MINYENIKNVHLEISSRCNAACPDCPRNIRGYGIANENFDLVSFTLLQIETIFTKEFVQQLTSISINGNHGDFISCRDGLEIVKYLRSCSSNLKIEISTNASGQPGIWESLGSIPDVKVTFRLDGLADTHSIYRQNTDYDLILNNAKKFIKAGGYAIWAMIKFDYNCHQIEQAQSLSAQMGFKEFELVDAGRDTFPIFNRYGEFVRDVGTVQIHQSLQDLLDRREFRIKNPDKILQEHAIYKQNAPTNGNINCKTKRDNNIYIQANGQVYPCCWTGFWPDKNVERIGNDQIKKLSNNNNALDVGIKNAITWFSELEKTWDIPTVSQGRSYICNETCSGCN